MHIRKRPPARPHDHVFPAQRAGPHLQRGENIFVVTPCPIPPPCRRYMDDAFAHHPVGFFYEKDYNGYMNWLQNLTAVMPSVHKCSFTDIYHTIPASYRPGFLCCWLGLLSFIHAKSAHGGAAQLCGSTE